MSKVFRDLIEYNNVNEYCYSGLKNFSMKNKDFLFCIPKTKSSIEQIVKVSVYPCILNEKLVKTPKGISVEGQRMTGYKYMVEGDFEIKYEYVSLDECQGLHCIYEKVPFCSYAVMPESFNENTVIKPNIVIQDINSIQMDCRCIYNNITFVTTVDIC